MSHGVRNIILAVWLLGSGPVKAFAGAGESDPRAMAMGRAQTAVAQNTEAYMWNPANLGIDYANKNKLTLNVFAFGFRIGNNVMGISDYNHYNGRAFTTTDKKNFLGLFGSDHSLDGSADGEARALGIQYRNYALNFEFGGGGFIQVPKEIFNVVLSPDAYAINGQNINARGNASGNALFTVAASAGFPIRNFLPGIFKEFSVGGSVKYIQGLAQYTMSNLNATVQQSDSLIVHARYGGQQSTGGSGMGLNFGITGQINKRWSVGLAIQNIYSKINWKTKTKDREADLTVNSADLFGATKKKNRTNSDTTYLGNPYTTKLPSILRVGAGYQMDKKTLFAFDYEQFLTKQSGKTYPRVAAGAEFHTWDKVYLRTGMSLGGDNRGFNVSGGAGFLLGKTSIDLATNNLEGLIILRRFSFALSLKVALQ
jgi:hypothetical protein